MTTYTVRPLDTNNVDVEHLEGLHLPPGVYAVSTASLHNGRIEAYRLYRVGREEQGRDSRDGFWTVIPGVSTPGFFLWGDACTHQRAAADIGPGRWIRIEVDPDNNVHVDTYEGPDQ